MGQVQQPARHLGQGQVSRHHGLFRRRRYAGEAKAGGNPPLGHHPAAAQAVFLAVVNDGHGQVQGVGQGQAHQVRVGHRIAVIAVAHRAGCGQFLHLGQFPTFPALGYRADGEDAHYAVGLRPLLDQFHHRLIVNGRVGVGHTAQGGKPAPGGGPGAGGDGLLVLVPRFPEVGVEVNETRGRHQVVGRNGMGAVGYVGRRQDGAGGENPAIPGQDVPHQVHTPAGVNDAGALKQNRAVVGSAYHFYLSTNWHEFSLIL